MGWSLMGWIKDVSPSLVDFRIEFRADVNHGKPANDGTGTSAKPDRLVTLHVDPMSPTWMRENAVPIESQAYTVISDVPEELSDLTKGDVLVWIDRNIKLTAQARANVSPVTDYPCAELMVQEQTQMGRR